MSFDANTLMDFVQNAEGGIGILLEDMNGDLHDWDYFNTGRKSNGHHRSRNCKPCHETVPWVRPENSESKKKLSYWDYESLCDSTDIGLCIEKDPFASAAISKLKSYVVRDGHKYETCPTRDTEEAQRISDRINEALPDIQKNIQVGSRKGWYAVQEEGFRRKIRGEYLRRWRPNPRDSKSLYTYYIEPKDVKTPESWSQINNVETLFQSLQNIPDTGRDPVPGKLGVVYSDDPELPQYVIGYFVRSVSNGSYTYTFVPEDQIHHVKTGVDSNDPRGQPLFYPVWCYLTALRKILSALTTLMLVRSKYAAIILIEQGVQASGSLRGLSQYGDKGKKGKSGVYDRARDEHESPGTAVFEGGVRLELPSANVRVSAWVELMQLIQRIIGNIADLPEFMITGDANTGNRSSLNVANDPFMIRIAQEQKEMFESDEDLLWQAVRQYFGWGRRMVEKAKRLVRFTTNSPIDSAKEWAKTVEVYLKMAQREVGIGGEVLRDPIISMKYLREKLGIDTVKMEQEINDEGLEDRTPISRPDIGEVQ